MEPRKTSRQRAAALFRLICPKTIFLKPVEAELAKLFCNAWRYINFAISNQFWVIANQFEADFLRIHQALRQDYPRMQSMARPGFAAGPCLLKDTMQLGAFNHGSFVLGQAAMMINEGLPYLLVQDIKRSYPLDGNDGRLARHGLQAEQRRPAFVPVVQAAQGAVAGVQARSSVPTRSYRTRS